MILKNVFILELKCFIEEIFPIPNILEYIHKEKNSLLSTVKYRLNMFIIFEKAKAEKCLSWFGFLILQSL